MAAKQKQVEPELIIHVSPRGVSRVRIPFRTLAEEKAGLELQEKCSVIINLLNEVAAGRPSEIAPPQLEPSSKP